MIKYSVSLVSLCLLMIILSYPHQACSGVLSDIEIKSLPDSSFVLIEIKKDRTRIRHFPYKDRNGHLNIDQLIYSLGDFDKESWLEIENQEIARKKLEECYCRFKLKQLKEGTQGDVNINKSSLETLVSLPNIGPVTAVKIWKYRKTHGPFIDIEQIKKVEGIGPAKYAGIKHYIRVR